MRSELSVRAEGFSVVAPGPGFEGETLAPGEGIKENVTSLFLQYTNQK